MLLVITSILRCHWVSASMADDTKVQDCARVAIEWFLCA